MNDAVVGVKQSPTPDTLVDNLSRTNGDGQTVATQRVADFLNNAEYLEDQEGAGAVLTFTFAGPQALVFVRASGGTVRAVTGAATPTLSLGAPVADGETFPLPVRTTAVKVFAPTGATVSVWGLSY